MEVTRGKRSSRKLEPRTRRQLAIAHWRGLGEPPVGARELKAIQEQLRDRFGENAVDSPAAIARILADEGAELRHPEVLECDAQWREARIIREAQQFSEIDLPTSEPLTLGRTEALIERWEKLRTQNDSANTHRIRTIAIEGRRAAQLLASKKTVSELQRAEQLEIAEWLGVWIKTPNLFKDWLELRRRSPEFQRKLLCQNRER